MDITVSRSHLFKELTHLNTVVEKKNTIPILACLRLEGEFGKNTVQLAATDFESALRTECPAEVKRGGAALIPVRRFTDIVRNLPESPVTIRTTSETGVQITCGDARFRLLSPSPEDYPQLPEPPPMKVSVPGGVLRAMLGRVMFAASNEESRYQLKAVQWTLATEGRQRRLRMAATDGHRMSLVETQLAKTAEDPPAEPATETRLIDRKSLTELARLSGEDPEADVIFGWDDNHAAFQCGRRLFVVRLGAGMFPNYQSILPKDNDKCVLFEREVLAAGLKRVGVIASEMSYGVKLTVARDRIELAAESPESGEAVEQLSGEYDGPTVTIGFNCQYVLDYLSAVTAERIRFEFKDEISVFELRSAEEDPYRQRYVVMPLRLS